MIWIDLSPAVMSARRSTHALSSAGLTFLMIARRSSTVGIGIFTAATRGFATIFGLRSPAISEIRITMLSDASSCGASDQRCSITTLSRSFSDENDASPFGASISAYSITSATLFCENISRSSAGSTLSGERSSNNASASAILPAFFENLQPVDRL